MEKPQRARSGLKWSPGGPKSPVQSWTAVLNIGAQALAGGDGDLSVISSGVMGRLGIDSDDDSWRWLVEVDRVVVSDYWRVYASCAAGCDAARQP